MHVGSVMVFQPPDDGFDYDRLVPLVSARIAFVPRYRQRVREIPGRLANPVWVDDEDFDVTYHVRRSALPRPGTDEQLQEFVARIQPRPLDRDRPLWEVYLVEGLEPTAGSRSSPRPTRPWSTASTPSTSARSSSTVDPEPRSCLTDTWRPSPEPSDVELLAGAIIDAVRRPERGHRHRPRRARRRPGRRRAGAAAGRASSRRRWPARRPGRRPPARSTSTSASARRFAMVGHRPRGLPQGPHPARRAGARRRRDRQRRRARHGRRGPAHLAADPRRAGAPRHDGARDGARERPRRRRRTATLGNRVRPASSTCRSASRGPSCGCTRSPSRCAQQRRPARRSAPRPWSGSPGSPRRRCTRSAPGWPARCRGGCSTSSSPTCPARSTRCTPADARMLATYPVMPLAKGQALSASG